MKWWGGGSRQQECYKNHDNYLIYIWIHSGSTWFKFGFYSIWIYFNEKVLSSPISYQIIDLKDITQNPGPFRGSWGCWAVNSFKSWVKKREGLSAKESHALYILMAFPTFIFQNLSWQTCFLPYSGCALVFKRYFWGWRCSLISRVVS